jgi:hypothetical protein
MAKIALKQKIVVVGAGPVGALSALYAAQRGHDVEVYELRNGTSLSPPPRIFFSGVTKISSRWRIPCTHAYALIIFKEEIKVWGSGSEFLKLRKAASRRQMATPQGITTYIENSVMNCFAIGENPIRKVINWPISIQDPFILFILDLDFYCLS